jgi:small subunit ribosomal protein S1
VVNPGEELWVKIIDIDLQRRRISLSIKQAAEGGEVSEEYREAFGEHAYDDQGNYIGTYEYAADTEFTPETEAQAAWADYVATATHPIEAAAGATETATEPPAEAVAEGAVEAVTEAPAEPPAAIAEPPVEAAVEPPVEATVEAPAEAAPDGATEVPAVDEEVGVTE